MNPGRMGRMQAVEIRTAGGPEVLQLTPREKPIPAEGEVLIRVIAAGVNRPDVMQRQGLYPPPPGISDIPGLEVAGEIVEVGRSVSGLNAGDRVCALLAGGGYAEYAVAAATLCLPFPKGLGAVEAASLPEALFTVWHNVFQRGGLRSGERFLVHGGTSGIGVAAIQLARAFGATVFTTAGTDEKCRFCSGLGADAIHYRDQDFVEEVKTRTAGQGVDLILDIVGGDYLRRNLDCLAADGRLVQIAVQQGPETTVNLLPILLKRLTVTGSTLRPRPVAVKTAIADELRSQVWPLLDSGLVKPFVHATFPLSGASDAHRLMESSRHIGKIVLQVAES